MNPPYTRASRLALLESLLQERILVLDGAMGTEIQKYRLTEADFRGDRFADWPTDVRGNSDLLVLTRPDVIRAIHAASHGTYGVPRVHAELTARALRSACCFPAARFAAWRSSSRPYFRKSSCSPAPSALPRLAACGTRIMLTPTPSCASCALEICATE